VLAVWLPYGYCNAVPLPEDEREAESRLTDIKEKLIPYATTKHLLGMNGCDHVKPERHLSNLLGNLNGRLKNFELVHSTLEKYVKAVKAARPGLETVRGEFRVQKASHGGQWLLQGVLSSRVPLKQANQKAQDSLERWAEPYSAIAWLLDAEYPQPFIWKSWEYLLQNHPHDSICGCSIDEVHRDMKSRFDSSLEISNAVTRKALEYIGRKVNLDCHGLRPRNDVIASAAKQSQKGTYSLELDEKVLLVFNPLPWEREDLVNASLVFDSKERVESFRILDAEGREVPYMLQERFDRDRGNTWNVVDGYNVQFLSRVPACGYNSYKVTQAKACDYRKPSALGGREKGKSLITAHGAMENEYLMVRIQPDGSLNLFDKENKENYSGLNVFEDGGDAGDEYNYSYPAIDRILNTRGGRAEIKLLTDTPLFASYRINVKLSIPCGLTPDRKSRSEKTLKHSISSIVTFWRGAKRVDVVTGINNNAEDHRLRVLFPSRAKTDVSVASGKFDILYRPVKSEPKGEYTEEPSRTHPHDGWVMAHDRKRGIMVAAQGLLEYEVREDAERTIALTLLRSVGWLSRPDLLTRDDNAGPPAPTPDAQCPGNHTFHYAIIPAGKRKSLGGLQRQAYQHNIPMDSLQIQKNRTGGTLPPVDRKVYPVDKTLPLTESFISLEPEEMILTSAKKAEDANGIILRFFNSGEKDKNAILKLFKLPKKANLVNLNETPVKKIQVGRNGTIKVKAKKKEIVTVRLNY
jgi:alpha-mannosidase